MPDPSSAPFARAFVRDAARRAGFDGDSVAEIELAAGEAITNAIRYGNGTEAFDASHPYALSVGIAIEADWSNRIRIEVRDHGKGFDPDQVFRADADDVFADCGRGLFLMRALMDDVDLRSDATGTTIRMERALIPSA